MLAVVRIWIIISSILVGSGWLLSALHQLNRGGYLAIFAMTGVAFIWWLRRRQRPSKNILHQSWHKSRRRFRRGAPRLFLVLVILSLISGSLYPALNYDANSYRLPRIFHWLAENQWHMIKTEDARMNISACGHEWLATALVALSHTDRLIFLINWTSFLLLPGLIFSVFTRLHVGPRVAWWWMWFLSAGWCYVLQASSVANDGFAAVYALASVDLALRAREKQRVSDLWLSALAAALLSGVKQTNIPLVLLWLLAAWPARTLIRRHLMASLGVTIICLLVSVAPISIINYHQYGSWMPMAQAGLSNIGEFQLNPFWGVVGNAFCIPLQNFFPPYYEFVPPFYDYMVPGWNDCMAHFLQSPFGSHFSSFEKFGYFSASYYRCLCEGNAGIGLGACLVLLAALYEGHRLNKQHGIPNLRRWRERCTPLRVTPWFLLLVFMAKVGTFENARQLAPYYPFLFPLILTGPSCETAIRHKPWKRFGLAVMVLTCMLVFTQPTRPLFPAQTIANALGKNFPDNSVVGSECWRYIWNNFRAIDTRRQWLERNLPPNEKDIGFYAGQCDVDEPGIWLPWNQHRARWITAEDSPTQLHRDHIRYAVVINNALQHASISINDFTAKYNATVVATCPYIDYQNYQIHPFNKAMVDFYLIRLN